VIKKSFYKTLSRGSAKYLYANFYSKWRVKIPRDRLDDSPRLIDSWTADLRKWRGHFVRFAKLQPVIAYTDFALLGCCPAQKGPNRNFSRVEFETRRQQRHLKRLDNLASFCQTPCSEGLYSYHHYAPHRRIERQIASRQRPLLVASMSRNRLAP